MAVSPNGSFSVDGGNVIRTSTSNIDAGFVQFSLQTSPNITWWKGIKVVDASGNQIVLLETQDASHGPTTGPKTSVSSFSDEIRVEIWKAKTFGVHTQVDTVSFVTNECNSHNITLNWQND
jgi:hypothetical protein